MYKGGPRSAGYALIVAGVMAAASAQAQETEQETEIVGDQDTIVVTATRTEKPLLETPAAITVKNLDDLRELGFTYGTDEFRGVPGVFFRRGEVDGDEFPFITIRGVTGNHGNDTFLALIDGIPFVGPDEEVLLTEIPYGSVENVEIVRGPVSALYGRGAIAGAVNYLTRTPTKNGARLEFTGGSDDYYRAAGGVEGTIGDFSFLADAAYENYDGWRENSARETLNLLLKGVWSPTDQTALTAYLSYINRSEIGLVEARSGAYRTLTPESLHARSISSVANNIAFIGQSSGQPPEVWSQRIGEDPVQTTSIQPDISIAVPHTENVSWRAGDGISIEGLLTYPINWREGDPPAPLLIRLHGGPAFAAVQEFIGDNSFTAYPTAAFAAAGYGVFQPNYRGSAGRGFGFRSANVGEWGRADVADVVAGVDALIKRGIADESRLGVMGWSYGGYLAAMTIVTDDRFYAASIGAGISDVASWWGGTDFKYHVDDYFDGSPLEKPRLYRQRSPALLAGKVADTKVLIQHGGADQRVPPEQAQYFYRALLREGKTAALDLYPDMGHSAFDPATRLDILQRNFDWFSQEVAAR